MGLRREASVSIRPDEERRLALNLKLPKTRLHGQFSQSTPWLGKRRFICHYSRRLKAIVHTQGPVPKRSTSSVTA